MTTFDLESVLGKIKTGDIKVAPAPTVPADTQVCPDPDCDGGFVPADRADPFGPTVPCLACVARRAQKTGRSTLKNAGLADTIYEVAWESLDLTHESWQVAKAYADSANELALSGQSLIFVGDYGRGKTQAATLILASAREAGHRVERVKWGQFVRRVRATYNRESSLTEDALIRAVVSPDLLLLDDVGAADKHSEHNERLLTAVIDERYDEGRGTIITTNLGREELEEHLGGRAFSRIWNNADTVVFDGPNYRELRERPQARGLAARIRAQVRQQSMPEAADD